MDSEHVSSVDASPFRVKAVSRTNTPYNEVEEVGIQYIGCNEACVQNLVELSYECSNMAIAAPAGYKGGGIGRHLIARLKGNDLTPLMYSHRWLECLNLKRRRHACMADTSGAVRGKGQSRERRLQPFTEAGA